MWYRGLKPPLAPPEPRLLRQGLGRVAEEWAGQAVVGRAEVGVVEDVEELASETEPHLPGEVKLPLQRKIHLGCSETARHIARETSLLTAGRWGKRCLIENLAARI